MEKHFLSSIMESHGEASFRAEPWYNADGDCIMYQNADEAVVADRADELLTIYRSALDDRPIGFQIKGVAAIIRKFGLDGLMIRSTTELQEVRHVSITAILLAAYEDGPRTISRRQAYATAIEYPLAGGIATSELQLS